MGAMARQVAQVKRKNSTSCNPPEASATVDGSVASSSGPREVATGCASADSVGASVASGWVGRLDGVALSVGVAATGAGVGEAAAGAQAEASKTANRLRVRKMREVVILLFLQS